MDEESLATDAEDSMVKELYRRQQCRNNPDIIHITKKQKKQDPSIEDLDLKIKKLEELFDKMQRDGNLSSEDELEYSSEDSDEEIYIPTQAHWFKLCMENWGTIGNEDGDDIKARVKASKQVFEIYTDGVFSNDGILGYGAVLRDCFRRPIVAWSRNVPKASRISTFYHKLQGIFLGVQLAKKYQVSLFHLYCSSGPVSNFILNLHRRERLCFCSAEEKSETHCAKCCMRLMNTDNKEEYEKAYQLILHIFSDVSALESEGLAYFHVSDVEGERNEAAHFMAELGEDKEMDLSQIREYASLSEILYKDAFGLFLEE